MELKQRTRSQDGAYQCHLLIVPYGIETTGGQTYQIS